MGCETKDVPATPDPAAVNGGGGEKPRGTTEEDTDKPPVAATCTGAPGSIYALSVKRLGAEEEKLCAYEGSVILIVNGASNCGYTAQYEPLQGLYEKYKETGQKFVVLGFPSDSFNQELADDKEVSEFCTDEYGITFPLFTIGPVIDDTAKNVVAQPVYKWLASQPGMSDPVSWNFEKFLVSKDGKVVKRWARDVVPNEGSDIDNTISAELARSP
ncbi:MAG: glutathione peroxidase [Labilithrix sp.]|nr:glutathione peroxidase [Labilithrix sp.]MCW5811362.1 glutathione peroxidase [Labilithrix sp.]